jgi:hypothetical protein
MTRAELMERIRTYRLDYTLEELEDSDTSRLEYILRLLEAHAEIESRDVSHLQRRGDEPPELAAEDEEILDRVWAQLRGIG